MKSKLKTALMVGTALAVVAGSASAQADITEATTGLTAVGTSVESLGQLMLGAVGAGIVYKWVVAYLI